jgi:hypothetical protein
MSRGDGFMKRKKNSSTRKSAQPADPYHFGGLTKVRMSATFPLGAGVLALTGVGLFSGDTAVAMT